MPMMKAIQVNSPGSDFELVRKEIPEPRENEILLKVQVMRNLPRGCGCKRRAFSRHHLSSGSRS